MSLASAGERTLDDQHTLHSGEGHSGDGALTNDRHIWRRLPGIASVPVGDPAGRDEVVCVCCWTRIPAAEGIDVQDWSDSDARRYGARLERRFGPYWQALLRTTLLR